MADFSFAGFNLNDGVNYLITETNYRGFGTRRLDAAKLARRPGQKLFYTDFDKKEIDFHGYIVSTTASGLQGLIDTLQQNVALREQPLVINDDIYGVRTYTATCSQLALPNQNYNQTFLPYSGKFLASNPFAYGPLLSASGQVASGVITFSGTTTISGNVFAEPTISLYPTSLAAGDSGIRAFQVGYTPAGENLTVSGVLSYTSPISLNYANYTVTVSGINGDFNGAFSRWEPGTTAFTITTSSGLNNSYNYVLSYQPRYYT